MGSSNDPFRARRRLPFQPGAAVIAFEHIARIRRDLKSVGRKSLVLLRPDNWRLYLIAAGFLVFNAPQPPAGPQTARDSTLQEAKHLAWLNNWTEAAAVLDRLESSGLLPPDEATALFSRAAHIRGNIEAMSLPAAADEVASMLASGTAMNDSALRLELLAIKGDIEFQYSLPAAQATWEEARHLAASKASGRWQTRAEGELGTIAFLNGEILAALRLVAGALVKADLSGDVAAQIRYRTALGEGLAEFGRTADAIRSFLTKRSIFPPPRPALTFHSLPT